MKKTTSLKSSALDLVKKAAVSTAKKSANTTCAFWNYQQELPAAVKKLRKF